MKEIETNVAYRWFCGYGFSRNSALFYLSVKTT
ncbi:hypothetical protein ACEQPO_21000 [Bacillus sp. SL00103]